MMLTNHPILMGADYHHDIQRLKGMFLRSCIINLTHDQNNYISDYRSQIRWKGTSEPGQRIITGTIWIIY